MVAATQHANRRVQDRFGVALDAAIDGEPARTLDLSATGVLLQARCQPPVGSIVWVALIFQAGGRPQRLGCYARVMRIRRRGDSCDIALRLAKSLFD